MIFEQLKKRRISSGYVNIRGLCTRLNSSCGGLGNERRARVVNRDSDNENGGLKSNFIFFTSVFPPINFNNKFPSHHATFETHYSKLIESEKKIKNNKLLSQIVEKPFYNLEENRRKYSISK